MRTRTVTLIGVCCLATMSAIVQTQTIPPIDLHQNWKPDEQQQFWFTPQGSLLLPYDWFLNLKQASSDELFRSDRNILRLGYVPSGRSAMNPDALPIGFARDSDREGHPFVGFTCAACHTSVLRIGNTDVTVEGAPTLGDFWTFLTDLVAALDDTATTPKFKDFADHVLGPSHTQQQEDALKLDLDTQRDALRQHWLSMPPSTPYGPARLDAFGGLYTQVVAYTSR